MGSGNLGRLRRFVGDFASLLAADPSEAEILRAGADALRDLVAQDDWLPDAFAQASGAYAQYLLHCDSLERFSIVSFVWSPGQETPVHDHTVWGLIGMLRGEEIAQSFDRTHAGLEPGASVRLRPGEVEAVSPRIGDIHKVSNAFTDRPSISIHVYGANIGAVERSAFNAAGQARRFLSGYSNAFVPNLWSGPPAAGAPSNLAVYGQRR